MEPAERRLKLMRTLCIRRYDTMSNLATEFGVSTRTIQRDIFELTFLMPLYVKTGRYTGGVYVDEHYSMDRMYMLPEEITLLIKVKTMVEHQLSQEELSVFNGVIAAYTKPGSK